MKVEKRIKQAIALLTHLSSIASKYDTPWDNVIYSEIKKLYNDNGIESCLYEELAEKLWPISAPETMSLRYLYDAHRTSGSVSPLELKVICDICGRLKPRNVLEIGTFEGRTTLNIASNTPNGHVYTMNLPQELCRFQVGKYFSGADEAGRITQILCNSREYDFSKLPQMDLIFIDGDHSYEGVAADSTAAFSCLADNGVILWHDFDACHLGTTKAVLDAIDRNRYSYSAIEGTSLAVGYRPPPKDVILPTGPN